MALVPVVPLAGFAGNKWATVHYAEPQSSFLDTGGNVLAGIQAVNPANNPALVMVLGITNQYDISAISATLDGVPMTVAFLNGQVDVSDGTIMTTVVAILPWHTGTVPTSGDVVVTYTAPTGFFLNLSEPWPFIFEFVDPVATLDGWHIGQLIAVMNDVGSGPGPNTCGPISGVDGAQAMALWMSYGNGIGFPPTAIVPDDFSQTTPHSIIDFVIGQGAISADGPYSSVTSGAHGVYLGSAAILAQVLPFINGVVPHITGSAWAQDLIGEASNVTGHVITQTFAYGTSAPTSDNLHIIAALHCEFSGGTTPSDITATYAGLPCTVTLVNDGDTSGDQRCMVIVQCIPQTTDTFTGSDFVVTIGSSTSYVFYYHGWAALSSNVDSLTTLADAVLVNSGATLNPFQITYPAISDPARDMFVSTCLVDEVTQQPLLQSPAARVRLGISTQNWAAANRLAVANESNAAVWGASGAITAQRAYGFSLNVRALTPKVPVPNLIGLSQSDALDALATAGLIGGAVTNLNSNTVPVGFVMLQGTAAGAMVPVGSAVDYTVSLGAAVYVVPNVVGLSDADARTAITNAGLAVGAVTAVYNRLVPIGVVLTQSPAAGTTVPLLYPVSVVESAGPPPPAPLIAPFDVNTTVISQYAQSPTILGIVEAMAESLDPRANLENFYEFVWNVDTAVGFGLDIWGKIVNVSRLLTIPGTSDVFGFYTTDVPFDWQPWSQAPFAAGNSSSSTYLLPDDAYRTLILTKALANIAATTAPALNRLLQNLFPGRGVCYVLDNGNMSMSFVFNFPLTQIEFAILTQSGALPHPAGVFFDVRTIGGGDTFGFSEALPGIETFGAGTFYNPP